MLLSGIFIASVLSWPAVSAMPGRTQYANSTSIILESAAISSASSFDASSCPVNCAYTYPMRKGSYWSKYIDIATVAAVVVVINDSNNTTNTVTSYVQSLLVNGTAPTNDRPPPTNTNQAGTVTEKIKLLNGQYAIFAYPTVYYEEESALGFSGTLPYISRGSTTCISNDGTSLPLPPHTTWPTPTGTVDPEDRFGLGYIMEDLGLPGDGVAIGSSDGLINKVLQSCKPPILSTAKPVMAVSPVYYLTVTSTAHVSDPIAAVPSTLSPQPATLIDPQERPNPTATSPSVVSADIYDVRVTVPSSPSARNPTLDLTLVTDVAPGVTSLPDATPALSSGTLVFESNGPASNDQKSVRKTSIASLPAITPLGHTYPAGPEFTSGYIYETQTLIPGGPVISVSGNLISLASEAASQTFNVPVAVVIAPTDSIASSADTQLETTDDIGTQTMNGLAESTAATIPYPTGQTAASVYILGTQTLTPGGPPITVSGKEINLANGETLLVVGTGSEAQIQTTGIAGFIASSLSGSPAAPTTDTGQPNSVLAYIIGTQTLVPGGPAITVSGAQISLAPSGTEIILGTGAQMQTKTTAISGYIVSSLGGSALTTGGNLNSSDYGTAQTSMGSTTPPGENTTSLGGSTTTLSNISTLADAAHSTQQVEIKALQFWAAVWCIWALHHV